MTQAAIGGPAQTTYRVTDRALVTGRDAQRVFVVSDGRPAEGGPQQAVYYVSDAEIAAGDFVISGNKPIPIVEVGAAGAEYPPMAVYVVTASSESDFPPIPPPTPPQFSSAEIGNVDNLTVVVTFDMDVSAAGDDYLTGVVVNVNGLLTVTSSGTRQANHAIVHYVITTPVANGDTVTWNYNDTTGLIVSEADGAPLADVAQASVTNNVAGGDPSVTLKADAVAYWKLDEASGNRADATGHGNTAVPVSDVGSRAGHINALAASFPGAADYLIVANGAQFDFGNSDFTLAGWVLLDVVFQADNEIIAKRNSTTGDLEFDVYSAGNEPPLQPGEQAFQFDFAGVGQYYPYVACSSLTPNAIGVWYFVLASFDASAHLMSIRINNGTADTADSTVDNVVESGSLYIGGNNPNPFKALNGAMEEWGIWHRLLTSDEQDYLYNSGAGRALFP